MMSGSGDGGCGDRCGRRCLRDRAFRGGVGIAGEKAWGGRHWGGASRVFDVQFLQVLGANVLSALVKAKLDQLKVDGVKTFLPVGCIGVGDKDSRAFDLWCSTGVQGGFLPGSFL